MSKPPKAEPGKFYQALFLYIFMEGGFLSFFLPHKISPKIYHPWFFIVSTGGFYIFFIDYK
jgi:hypothetical protein